MLEIFQFYVSRYIEHYLPNTHKDSTRFIQTDASELTRQDNALVCSYMLNLLASLYVVSFHMNPVRIINWLFLSSEFCMVK